VAVKAGDVVRADQILGHVGNTGSSAEPRLHMHIDGEPSFLGGNGLPYEFASGDESDPVEANVSSPTAVSFGPIGAQHPVHRRLSGRQCTRDLPIRTRE
jgi:hypothetical protein